MSNSTQRVIDKLNEVIALIEHHEKSVSGVMPVWWQKFTYEDHEFSSCMMCGHSDKALLYELNKVKDLLEQSK